MHLLAPFQHQVLRILIKPLDSEGFVDKRLDYTVIVYSQKK